MNPAFDLGDYDDGPTIVTPHVMPPGMTEVMDRRPLPPASCVMRVAPRPAPPVAPAVARAIAPASDATQPARRIRRQAAGMRRLAIGLAFGFAFVGGIAAAYVAEVATRTPVVATSSRAPRTVTDRSSSLDTRSAPLLREPPPKPAAVVVRTEPAPTAPTENAIAPASDDLAGHDLLNEGL